MLVYKINCDIKYYKNIYNMYIYNLNFNKIILNFI